MKYITEPNKRVNTGEKQVGISVQMIFLCTFALHKMH